MTLEERGNKKRSGEEQNNKKSATVAKLETCATNFQILRVKPYNHGMIPNTKSIQLDQEIRKKRNIRLVRR